MKLFGSKKEPQKQEKNIRSVNTANPVNRAEKSAEPVITNRMDYVFKQLYSMVISADMSTNFYRIELGDMHFMGATFQKQGYYTNWMDAMVGHMDEECKSDFKKQLSRESVISLLRNGRSACIVKTAFTDTHQIDNTEDLDQAASAVSKEWYEFRLEKVPTKTNRPLCMIYVRKLINEDDTYIVSETENNNNSSQEDDISWDTDGSFDEKCNNILMKSQIIIFEYEGNEDRLRLYRYKNGELTERITEHYLSNLDQRGDWTIFHEDVVKVRTLFKQTMNGTGGKADIRYRKNGDYKADFEHFKLSCVPFDTSGARICGTIVGMEDEYLLKMQQESVSVQMGEVLDLLHVDMYYIDLGTDRIHKIVKTKEGLKRENSPHIFSDYIRSRIDNGMIAAESARYYQEMLDPERLQYLTRGKRYEFESYQTVTGNVDYRWYEESVSRADKNPMHFYRFRRDITKIHENRVQEQEAVARLKFEEYNHSMLDTMASLVEFRNVESGDHIKHVRILTNILLHDVMRRSPDYNLNEKIINMYTVAATIHDIGKITIPDSVLNKQGRFTEEEYATMKSHTTNGGHIIEQMNMGEEDELKDYCRDVALHHHERYDGRGYPDGLVGDENRIGTQAIGLVDAFDALVSERVYKDRIEMSDAEQMILDGKCGKFSDRLLESFKACSAELRAVYEK